jgi:hypothetical protein
VTRRHFAFAFSPSSLVAVPSAAPARNSTVEAARQRVRGPTITQQRERAAADAEKMFMKQRKGAKRKAAVCEAAGTEAAVVAPSALERRGRARLNAPLVAVKSCETM